MQFRGVLLLICAFCVTLGDARSSPNVDVVKELFGNDGSRYSNNLIEDASLDVPDLIRKYGYPVEVHHVSTQDGYILEMHRIPHGRDANNRPDPTKPVVFLMHGLLCSSSGWVLAGPTVGLAYILAEEGYDVWMGNARGNYYSRRHISYNPDSFNVHFWRFSWDEIGYYDLPAMIDFALRISGQRRLHYIGHSQGTTTFFVMGSLRPEYNDKIISMQALAPVAYMGHNRNRFLLFIAPFAHQIEAVTSLIGMGEFMPNNDIMTWAGQAFCRDEVITQPICSNIFFLIGGWNEEQLNTTLLPVKFGHTPAGAAVRQLVHYGQGITEKEFRRYDHGSRRANRDAYGSDVPPKYDLSKITAPVFLHFSDNDPLAEVEDVQRLFRELGRPVGLFRVQLRTFNHIDFLWAIDVKALLYNRVLNFMRTMNNT